jgi:cell wall-associated NlpC family hydrolase
MALMLSATSFAQNRERVATPDVDLNEISCSPDDTALLTFASAETHKTAWEVKAKPIIDISTTNSSANNFGRLQPLLLAAIDDRLGARYSWGATGPNRYDCSGFVWSIFQSVGIDFERASARTLFNRFAPAAPDEQFKFGTLVFFSRLAHVGVVADEHGFYHASRHHGVVYSPFNEYWLKRIDGFRRVPLPLQVAD